MRHRNHRIVKLAFGPDRVMWVVVSTSMRDDGTWDVLHRARSRQHCEEWVADVERNNTMLALAGRG